MTVSCSKERWRLNLLQQNDVYWRTRGKHFQIEERDRNISFFHQRASMRKKQNRIDKLFNETGIAKTTQGNLEKLITNFYSHLFSSEGSSNAHSIISLIPRFITIDWTEMNEALQKPFTEAEFKRAVKIMHPMKAPGLDGIHAIFYQSYSTISTRCGRVKETCHKSTRLT